MRFVIKQSAKSEPAEPSVELTTEIDSMGDFVVYANGSIVLWLHEHGVVQRCALHPNALKAMGFRMDGNIVKDTS